MSAASSNPWPADSVERRPIAELVPYARNARTHGDAQVAQIAASMREWGWTNPILIDEDGTIIAGHGRVLAARLLEWQEAPVMIARGWSDAQKRAYIIADNKLAENAGWDPDMLAVELDELRDLDFELPLIGFDQQELNDLIGTPHSGEGGAAEEEDERETARLAERFLVPPFSVLSARDGWWKERKRAWLALGIQSELGRGENLLRYSAVANAAAAGKKPYQNPEEYEGGNNWGEGSSVFDPVLCEIAYRWYSPPGGLVLDPFAGGSVRGIVATKLGRRYLGIDLSGPQLTENRRQARQILGDGAQSHESAPASPPITDPQALTPLPADPASGGSAELPQWIEGDSRDLLQLCSEPADFVFSCPPYADLERYSEDPRDLSTLDDYLQFREAYSQIIANACERLKADRFACFVVGEVRDKRGALRDFVGDTVQAFSDAGLKFYNDAILVTSLGSLPIRAARIFESGRKLGRTHQYVLIFVKGDPRKAVAACGEVEVHLPEGMTMPENGDDE